MVLAWQTLGSKHSIRRGYRNQLGKVTMITAVIITKAKRSKVGFITSTITP